MFETTTLNVRGLATKRDITRWSADGAAAARSSTVVAPAGSPVALARFVAWLMSRSRHSGLGSSQGSSRKMNEIRLPSSPAAPPARTLTGTIALSRAGVSPCRSR